MAEEDDLMQLAEIADLLEDIEELEELEEELEPVEVSREMLDDGTRIVYMSNGGRIVNSGEGQFIYDGDGILVEHKTPDFMGISVTRQYDPNEVGFGPDDDVDTADAAATASTTNIRTTVTDDQGNKVGITQVREGDVERDGVDKVMSNKPLMTRVRSEGFAIEQGPDGTTVSFTNPSTGQRVTLTGEEAEAAIKTGGVDNFVANKISAQFKPMGS